MFNFFKKKESPVSSPVNNLVVTQAGYPAIVKEIHNEFFTAGDEILSEATCLLKELEQKDLAKGKRLASLGFNKTREAVVAIETENKLATTKEIAELVVYYQTNYPNNKFITEEQVGKICEKYGLVCGDTTMYKGFVPESKVGEIEKFKVKDSDKCIGILTGSRAGDVWNEYIGYVSSSDIIGFWNENITQGGNATFDNTGSVKNSFSENIKIHFGRYHTLTVQGLSGIGLKICAPLKDMDIPLTHKLYEYKIEHIPDPVVLQPVNGGYLIVCAWGDEASDEIVVNQKMN